jgi:peptide/nickel transport system permease protein
MLRHFALTIGSVIPVLLGMTLVVFLLLNVLPADPIQVMITQSGSGQVPSAAATEETIANIRRELGLDRPLYEQFFSYVTNLASGDLGRSYRSNQPVFDMIAHQYPYTVRLALAGLAVTIVLGLAFGILAGLYPNSPVDRALMWVATLGISMPTFWLGLMLIYVFAVLFPVLPVMGVGSVQSMLLPAFTLGFPGAAMVARLTRTNLVSVLKEDFIVAARAKGLPGHRLIAAHALPNVLAPVLTIVGLHFGNLMTGTVIVETVFSRPGIGRLGVDAILQSDYPVIQGFALVLAGTYVLINLLVDIINMIIDPRVRRA